MSITLGEVIEEVEATCGVNLGIVHQYSLSEIDFSVNLGTIYKIYPGR